MIWLAWRRHRTTLLIAAGLVVALVGWMLLVLHWYDAAPLIRVGDGGATEPAYRNLDGGYRLFQLSYQIEASRILLLLMPCLLGVLLGVPLVAAELTDHTNRLAWTQGISRTRWLTTKWLVLGLPLVVLAGGLLAVSDWWTSHVDGVALGSAIGVIDSNFGFLYNSRIVPVTFSITGLVPVAYTAFAVALGCAMGTLLRRVPWATVGTVVVYGLAIFTMVTTVRPVLAPQTFVSFNGSGGYPAGFQAAMAHGPAPWDLGFVARFVPGFAPPPGSRSAAAIVASCDKFSGGGNPTVIINTCDVVHHVQFGEAFQLPSNYWVLQWREALIYLVATLLLLVVSWWAVRRWRA